MANWHRDQLRIGASVWTVDYKNGYITNIDYADKVVEVKFYNSGETYTYEFDVFIGCYDERLNQWVLPEGV